MLLQEQEHYNFNRVVLLQEQEHYNFNKVVLLQEQEQQATTEQVFQDRQYQIDAGVVRIMKARKSLTHNALIGELFRQLRFPAKVCFLRKTVDFLGNNLFLNDFEDQQWIGLNRRQRDDDLQELAGSVVSEPFWIYDL